MFLYNKTLRLDAEGLGMFLFPYQLDAIRYLYAVEEANSREIWEHVNRPDAPDPKSRASIINLLEGLRQEGLVESRDTTGKGGHHGLYSRHKELLTLEDFTLELIERVFTRFCNEFNLTIQYIYHTKDSTWRQNRLFAHLAQKLEVFKEEIEEEP